MACKIIYSGFMLTTYLSTLTHQEIAIALALAGLGVCLWLMVKL